MKEHRARLVLGTTAVLSLLAVAGCTPGGSSTTDDSSTAAVSDDVAAAGDVTLRLSDFWGSAEGEWIDAMIEQFEAEYPNVTIDRTTEDWGQLTSTLNLQLQDPDGPDIASANNGWQSLGTLARGNLVRNLDDYAELYGWDDEVPTTIARQNQFTTDFTTIGSGSWFATPLARGSLIGLYYNVEKLDALGLEPPQTLDDLEAAAAAAADAGEIPFAYGSVDGGTAVLLGVQAMLADKDALNDFIYDDPGVTAADTSLTEAATTIKAWADSGWFTPSYEGIDYQTAVANFLDGQGVFRFEYTGSLGLSGDQLNQFGYVQLAQDSGETVGVGAAPGAMVISSSCEHPDVAAAFLDHLMSAEGSQTAVDMGLVPMLNTDVTLPDDALSLQGEATATQTLDADDGYVPYIDWASPTLLDTITQNMQLLYAGKVTPQQLTDAVEADRTAFLEELGQDS
ncbi:MAG: extracellular solute-binding protein [Micrococcales bacterium]|nr:extracellular solute-binding protein [Micrococcales bacterium]